ncbi:hypothetical protein R1sor_017184 [Riccia sorocarpa]|uniref:Peroxidase n=1 Tax=Riccia sorocarpa TaxID=122646 RepID=A0ABD3IA40_9MARC
MTGLQIFLRILLLLASAAVPDICAEASFGGAISTDLQVGFYSSACPGAEDMVRQTVEQIVAVDKKKGASLIRLLFHDCFVEGCDGSILIDSTSNNTAEKDAFPNLTLRGLAIIDEAKSLVEARCPGIVSCADIIALAARDSVNLLGGPHYEVRTGRRDGRVSIDSAALSDLPAPTVNDVHQLISAFAKKGLSQAQMVTLSGLHTVGQASCAQIVNRLYNFSSTASADPTLEPFFAGTLRASCPKDYNIASLQRLVDMDQISPDRIDRMYFVSLLGGRGLLTSDATLARSRETLLQVFQYAAIPTLWESDLVAALQALGEIEVKTGEEGEIRLNCRAVN